MLKPKLSPNCFIGIVLIISVCNLFGKDLDKNLKLASNGKTDYKIIVSENSTTVDDFAIAELQKFLNEITGADFKKIKCFSPEAMKQSPRIFLGWNPVVSEVLGDKNAFESLEDQECAVISKGADIFLYGRGKHGNLYAVYEFLENQLGCRWYTAYGDMQITKRPNLEIAPVNSTVKKSFSDRSLTLSFFYCRKIDASLFFYRNRQNNLLPKMPGVENDKCIFAPTCHTFASYIPPGQSSNSNPPLKWLSSKNYFTTNPEYFSMNEAGERVPNNQLCLSNQKLRKELTKNILEQLRMEQLKNNGVEGIVTVDCNDISYNLCYCQECKKLQDRYKSPGGPLFDYLIELCGLMKKENPGVMIKTLAYQETQTEIPPNVEKLPDNLIVVFAPINSNFLAPLEHATNASVLKNLKGWCKISKNVWLWYYPNTYNYGKAFFTTPPAVNFDRIAKDIRLFKYLGVAGVLCQHDSGGVQYCTNFSELQTWIMLKLLQNPSQDISNLIVEFTDFYYGKASQMMREYLSELEDLSQKLASKNFKWSVGTLQFSYLTKENIAKWKSQFDQMEELTKDDPDSNFHVRIARFGLDAAEVTLLGANWDKSVFNEQANRLTKAFQELCEKRLPDYKTMYIRKTNGTIGEWLTRMGRRTTIPPKDIPEEFKHLGNSKVIIGNPNYLVQKEATLQKDSEADLGMAVFAKTDGKEFKIGFYDSFNKRYGANRTLEKTEIIPDTYQLYKLNGFVKLSPECQLFGDEGKGWKMPVDLSHLCSADDAQALNNDWVVYVSLKFEGPAYSEKSKDKPNMVLCDRVILVKGDNIKNQNFSNIVTDLPTDLDPRVSVMKKGSERISGSYIFTEIPASLENAVIIVVKRGDGTVPGSGYSITLTKDAMVYLFVANTGDPVIPNNWTLTELKATWGTFAATDKIYQCKAAVGVLEIPEHGGSKSSSFGIPNACVIVPIAEAKDTNNKVEGGSRN